MTDRPAHRLKSFVRRQGRFTPAQREAEAAGWPQYGLDNQALLNIPEVFNRAAPTYLEIGFGMGHSLLALAEAHPDMNFIGVETHKPGIGALLLGIAHKNLQNIRIYNQDIIDILTHCIAPHSLDGIHIFFPDPWPKRKHHPRRLIQPAFITLLLPSLKTNGTLHLATDWEDYAMHMMKVLSAESTLENLAGQGQFATRSLFRPLITKFENRALKSGRGIWELQFRTKNQ